ncbi:MAG TPA: hypothetical protein VFB27_13150 [Opitutaceae bacterium]|nr:hypothetical protein [Opitutaceae bacterium]
MIFASAHGAVSSLTDSDYAAFGQQLAVWLSTHDMASIRASFDNFALADRVMQGMELSQSDAIELRNTMLHGDLLRNFATIHRAHFLRVVQRQGGGRALLRVHFARGIDYLEFICVRQPNGKPMWVDLYTYSAGDTLSSVMRAACLPIIAEGNKNILERLSGEESSYVKHLSEINRVAPLYQANKFAEAAAVLKQLPPDLQTNRTVLMARLRVMKKVDDAEYLKVIEDWERAYPNDPALAMIAIDADILRKDFSGALRAVDTLDRLVGGDPYQDGVRATIYLAEKNYPAAKLAAAKALRADPTLTLPYDVLLDTSLAEENYNDTVKILEDFAHIFPAADMATAIGKSPEYAKFRLSSQYAEWIKRRSPAGRGAENKQPQPVLSGPPATPDK